jgi:hypothetical protein
MSHSAMVNDGVSTFVVLLTLLLVMFLYAVSQMPPGSADSPDPPAPAPPARARRAQPPATAVAGVASAPGTTAPESAAKVPAGMSGHSRHAGYAARHAVAPVPGPNVIHPPQVSGGPPWEPAPRPPGPGPADS